MLVVDAYPSEEIVELGANAYWEDNPQGIQAMVYYIYLRGVLDMQVGESPKKVLETLLGILPPDPHWQIEEQTVQYLAEPERRFFQIRPVFQDADTREQIAELESLLSDPALLHMFMENFNSYLDALTDCVYALALNKELCEKFLSYFSEKGQRILKEQAVCKYDIGDRNHISIAGILFSMKALKEREEALTTRKEETEKAQRLLEEIRQDAMEKLKHTKDGFKELKWALETACEKSESGWAKRLENALREMLWDSNMVCEYGLHKLSDYNFPSEFLDSIARQVVDEVRPELIIRNAADTYWMNEPEEGQAMVDYIYLRGMIRIRQGNIYDDIYDDIYGLFRKELESRLLKE